MSTLYQALVRYAASSDRVTPPYFADSTYLWQLDLDVRGRPVSPELVPLTRTVATARSTAVKPGVILVTPRITRTSGISPMLCSDDIAYVLGWADANLDEAKARARHAAFVDLARSWAAAVSKADDVVPHALLSFLEEHVAEVGHPAEWTSKDGVLVTVGGAHAHESPSAAAFWADHSRAKKSGEAVGPCVVCGTTGPLVDSFPQVVKGRLAPGGQPSGVAPISINERAYGFGLEKGLRHVPVCESCAYAIPAALNALLSDRERTQQDSLAATTWWVEGGSTFDPLTMTGTADEKEVTEFLRSVRTGAQGRGSFDPAEFHALTVSGNAARLVIERWWHLPVALLKQHVASWFAETEIAPRYADGRWYHPLWMIAQATGRHDGSRYVRLGDRAGRHPHGVTQALEDAALGGTPVATALVAHVLQRISADRRIDDLRAAFLRLALTRSRLTTEAVMPGLDPENTSPCYVLGRLFAAYEGLQIAAARSDGGSAPNATFADKHLAGAISSPQLVLAAGERQSAAWLGKLRRSGTDHYHRRDIDEVIGLLDPAMPLPARAATDEQALFVMGYHHQRAATQRRIDEAVAARRSADEISH